MIPDLIVNLRHPGGTIRRSLSVIATFFVLLAALVGCEQPEGIVTYKIPTKVPEQLLPGKDRMLAVMVPRGDQFWFYKVLGPKDAVDTIDDQFRAFVQGIEFDDRDEPVLDSLPEGWRRGGAKSMRFATIDINTPTKQLDFSISSLPAPDKNDESAWDDYIQQNVNRWRGQVSLKPSTQKWAGGEPIDVAAATGQSIWVDIEGEPSSGGTGSMGMMSGMMPGTGGFGATPGAASATMPGDAGQASAPSMNYERPAEWQKVDVTPGGMREAAFSIGQTEVTVITAGGNLRSNVARWMGQVAGAAPEDAAVDAMLEDAEKFEVSGRPAQRFIIPGDPEKGQSSIDATIVEMDGGRSKFIKMTGDPETVAEQSDSMRTFLDSLSF